jgi:hypothetical protein
MSDIHHVNGREYNMTTKPKEDSEPDRSEANHGQFYRSSDLVAAVHRGGGGIFEGFRAAHAFGRIYAGTFTATPAAKELARAAHFQGTPVPVTARLSGASGNPQKKALNSRSDGTKFYLPDGTVTDLIGITLPAFFARTPEEFFAFVETQTPDPATGKGSRTQVRKALTTSARWIQFIAVVETDEENQKCQNQSKTRAKGKTACLNSHGSCCWSRGVTRLSERSTYVHDPLASDNRLDARAVRRRAHRLRAWPLEGLWQQR